MHSNLENLGESVRTVSSPRGCFVPGWQEPILCHAALRMVRLDHDRAHEDVQDPPGSGEGDQEVGSLRFDFEQERSPAWDRIEKAYQEAALAEAKRIDGWLDGVCPVCCTKRAHNGEVMVRYATDGGIIYSCANCYRQSTMPEWKKAFMKDYFKPIPESTWDYLNEPG